MTVTGYDRVSAWVIAGVLGLILTVAYLFMQWFIQHDFSADTLPPLEIVTVGGGEPDGNPDDSPLLESMAEEVPDPSLTELREDETQVEELFETIVEVADRAANPAPVPTTSNATGGNPGSASGTGGAALGFGPGEAGMPTEQRWFISFSDQGSLDEYARQLDFFGIRLGALSIDSGELAILSNLAAAKPSVERKQSGKDAGLYFLWQGGGRKEADKNLFKKAGITLSDEPVLHFYPPETEQKLLRLERDYAGRDGADIRRTYFDVRKAGGGYAFEITKQQYLR